MDNITPEQIQERFDKLSPELQKAISSPDVHAAIQRIGRDKGLMLDQVGDLVDQVGLVILGFAKASNFVSDITGRLSISNEKAREITTMINNEVLNEIRREVEANTTAIEQAQAASQTASDTEDHISAIEKEGGFQIERQASTIPANLPGAEEIEAKSELMAGIENPEPAKMKPAGDTIPQPFRQSAVPAEQKKEPLVEQLLRGSTVVPEQKVVKTAPQNPAAQPQPRPSGSDPYREAI